ncbi:fatty acid desaturase family protein [Candidatus Nitrosacidococcus tergens]|uniref:Putative Fatty acid desaturase n=1 Tax=Candidatus Nitrosacidococcus tergens TaxID=553981 RepID=A0A7G1Q9X1_9GAMM|nr:fatty acid desaturase family protein [Candidatus Nitrosacidococcus tergens]CAB1276286.1 putative Fatty acid desaturase [Candidatus Nitrosacidococcus tergens]
MITTKNIDTSEKKLDPIKSSRLPKGYVPSPELKNQLRELMQTNPWISIAAYIMDWGIIVGVATISWWVFSILGIGITPLFIYLIAALIIASRQKGLENMIHEASHTNLTRNRKLNDTICYWAGAMWLHPGLTLEDERKDHVEGHHGFFWDPVRDPKYRGHKSSGLNDLPQKTKWSAIYILVRALARSYRWKLFSIIKGGSLLKPARSSYEMARRIVVILTIVALAYLGLFTPFILYFFIPAILFLPIVSFIAQMSEHAGAIGDTEFDKTRNKLGFIQEYFFHPHGDGYHLVHHLYAGIPHHQLKNAHNLLMQDPVYRAGNHCYALGLFPSKNRSVLSDLVRTESI